MSSITSLPKEVLHHIFEYLPPKDLAYASKACKPFYTISKIDDLNARLPKLDPLIVQENALMLWNHLEGNFNVDQKGRLIPIHHHQFLKRFHKWICHQKVAEKVNQAIILTFKEIYRLNEQGSLHPKENVEKPCRLYVWKNHCYAKYSPADLLANKVLNSKNFLDREIQKAAMMVQGQADLYRDYTTVFDFCTSKDKRIVWTIFDGMPLIDSLFYKNTYHQISSD